MSTPSIDPLTLSHRGYFHTFKHEATDHSPTVKVPSIIGIASDTMLRETPASPLRPLLLSSVGALNPL